MSCKHEWIELKWSYIFGQKSPSPRTLKKFRTVCKRCDATPREIELEQQLAAANARIVELEAQVDFAKKALKGE